MYKTLEKYSNKDFVIPHYPYETYRRYLAQSNRQRQALAFTARQYDLQKRQGNITHKSEFYYGLDYKPKNCSKN